MFLIAAFAVCEK